MSLLGNILWILLGGGLAIFLEYLFSGFLLCCTIVGIPFGVQCMKLAIVGLIPFGRTIRTKNEFGAGLSLVMNVIWLLVGGIWIALTHVILAALCAITIIGIPFAVQHWKLASLALFPFGKEID
ncbi:MAG TPA: YccF domain-containing protein [Planctomycetota bacterium]|nr:YccF domain-containing protein [Planctomycetota bacterium]